MMAEARTSETSVDNYFKWLYIPEDKSERVYLNLFELRRARRLLNILKGGESYKILGTSVLNYRLALWVLTPTITIGLFIYLFICSLFNSAFSGTKTIQRRMKD
jgi:hypothetical protein